MAVYWFTPPTRYEKRGTDRLFGRVNVAQGQTVIKRDGVYQTVELPESDGFESAEEVYLGGHIYLINDEVATALTDAGYGEFLEEADAYGAGAYGSGDYS